MIAHIRQEDAYGCGPACLAMVTGRSYREVRDWFRVRAWQNARRDGRTLDDVVREAVEPQDFARFGIDHWEIERYLAEHGYACALRWKDVRLGEARTSWPPTPIAEASICCVQTVAGGHFVVWLRDGRVLNPAGGETTLDDPVFCGLLYVIGVCRMGQLTDPRTDGSTVGHAPGVLPAGMTFDAGELWGAYRDGAHSARAHHPVSDRLIERACDAYVKHAHLVRMEPAA